MPNVGETLGARHSLKEPLSAMLGPGPMLAGASGCRLARANLVDGAVPIASGRSYTGPGEGVESPCSGVLGAFSNAVVAAERSTALGCLPHEPMDS